MCHAMSCIMQRASISCNRNALVTFHMSHRRYLFRPERLELIERERLDHSLLLRHRVISRLCAQASRHAGRMDNGDGILRHPALLQKACGGERLYRRNIHRGRAVRDPPAGGISGCHGRPVGTADGPWRLNKVPHPRREDVPCPTEVHRAAGLLATTQSLTDVAAARGLGPC